MGLKQQQNVGLAIKTVARKATSTQLPNSQPEGALLLLMQFSILLSDSGQFNGSLPGCQASSHFTLGGHLHIHGDFQDEGTV